MKKIKINYKDELYKASLTAFFKNEADNDKLILGLSIAGIGFFISLIKDDTISELGFVISIIALIMFFATSFLIIVIFYYNRKQFLNIISSKGDADENPTLSTLDKVKYIPFSIAVIASAIFVLVLIFQQTHRSANMTKKINTNQGIKQEGISGITKANQKYIKNGISGIAKATKTSNVKTTSDKKNK
jgi:hypothetical protein